MVLLLWSRNRVEHTHTHTHTGPSIAVPALIFITRSLAPPYAWKQLKQKQKETSRIESSLQGLWLPDGVQKNTEELRVLGLQAGGAS